MEVQPSTAWGQDLDYNTVIVYFTADDLIGVSPPPPILREQRKGGSVCVCVVCVFPCVSLRVLTWAWV